MDTAMVIDLARHALWTAVLVCAPLLVIALVVGVLIGVIQAATSVNEATLSFIPKLLALTMTLLAFGSWQLGVLVDFTRQIFQRTLQQKPLDPLRQIVRRSHGLARRLGEKLARHCLLDDRALCLHPKPPSRQPPRQVRHRVALRPHHEPDHPFRRELFAGDDARPYGTRTRRIFSRSVDHGGSKAQERWSPFTPSRARQPWPLRPGTSARAPS